MWPFLLVISLLPIWRYPPVDDSLNFWQMLVATRKPRKHIPAEEAIEKARLAYADVDI